MAPFISLTVWNMRAKLTAKSLASSENPCHTIFSTRSARELGARETLACLLARAAASLMNVRPGNTPSLAVPHLPTLRAMVWSGLDLTSLLCALPCLTSSKLAPSSSQGGEARPRTVLLVPVSLYCARHVRQQYKKSAAVN